MSTIANTWLLDSPSLLFFNFTVTLAHSRHVVELVLALEEAFSIEIPDEDTEKIRTVKDAIEYIKTHVSA